MTEYNYSKLIVISLKDRKTGEESHSLIEYSLYGKNNDYAVSVYVSTKNPGEYITCVNHEIPYQFVPGTVEFITLEDKTRKYIQSAKRILINHSKKKIFIEI